MTAVEILRFTRQGLQSLEGLKGVRRLAEWFTMPELLSLLSLANAICRPRVSRKLTKRLVKIHLQRHFMNAHVFDDSNLTEEKLDVRFILR